MGCQGEQQHLHCWGFGIAGLLEKVEAEGLDRGKRKLKAKNN